MAIYQTGGYRVKASAVDKVKSAIKDFVRYVQASERGTQMYLAWQQKNDPTQFLHLFKFENEAAQTSHGESDAVKRFEAAYSPELVGGDVVFTDYEMVAGKFAQNEGSSAAAAKADAVATDAADVVRNFYDAVVKRDMTTARRYLADDLVFVGLFETYRSAEEYIKALTGLLAITVRLDVRKIIAEGNQAAVFFELETRAPAEAKVLVAEWHHVSNGKISHVESAFDGRPYEAMFTGKAA